MVSDNKTYCNTVYGISENRQQVEIFHTKDHYCGLVNKMDGPESRLNYGPDIKADRIYDSNFPPISTKARSSSPIFEKFNEQKKIITH